MNVPQQIESQQPTPEQLIQMLDMQLAGERGKRAGRSRNRALILVFGVLAIIAVGGIALMVAQQMLLDLQHGGADGRAAAHSAEVSEK